MNDHEPQAWETISSAYLLKRWWMNLRVDHVRLPTGVEIPEFHVVEYPDWACTLCITEEGDIVLVRQYRHGIGRVTLEFPAGGMSEGEDPMAAAQRELLEESGFTADDWHFIGRYAQEPSKHDNYAYLFCASGARKVREPAQDESEDISVEVTPVAELFRALETGEFTHGIHVIGLYWAINEGIIGKPASKPVR